jgi:hypothetical protein
LSPSGTKIHFLVVQIRNIVTILIELPLIFLILCITTIDFRLSKCPLVSQYGTEYHIRFVYRNEHLEKLALPCPELKCVDLRFVVVEVVVMKISEVWDVTTCSFGK